MAIERIGTADDREVWLEQRKGYLTASAIYGWRGPAYADPKNKWYFEDNNRDAIIAEKFDDYQKEFPPHAVVSMAHGAHDETNIIAKVADGLGCRAEPDNSMFTNSRWPGLAATVDAFLHCPSKPLGVNYCQEPGAFEHLSDDLRELDQTVVLEIKKSVSVAWARNQVPEYYMAQVQTQLHILEMGHAVIAAECIYPHPKEKWRKFWDLRATLIPRNPAWEAILDTCNKEFLDAKEQRSIR